MSSDKANERARYMWEARQIRETLEREWQERERQEFKKYIKVWKVEHSSSDVAETRPKPQTPAAGDDE